MTIKSIKRYDGGNAFLSTWIALIRVSCTTIALTIPKSNDSPKKHLVYHITPILLAMARLTSINLLESEKTKQELFIDQ